MNLSLTNEVKQQLKKIKQKQPQLFKKIQKQLKLFQENPKHPSLRTHKLKGNLSNTWSITIEGNTRMIYSLEKNDVLFFLIGSHDEVYRK